MADEIINKLGFDVNQALSALNRLDEALKAAGASFNTFGATIDAWNARASAALATMRGLASAAGRVANAMQSTGAAPAPAAPAAPAQPQGSSLWLPPSLQSQIQAANQSLNQLGQTGQQAGQQVAGGMTQAGNATNTAKQMADKFVVSWHTITRVVMTQMIVRVLSSIRNALKEATQSAIEFQQAIAEVRTIAPTIGRDFELLSREAAEFSKAFNIPLPQVTEGLYQSISNQFATMSERANVMHAAVKLARVGVMDFQDSIMLLTGTLNAYGMASSQSEEVAAKFFNTIRLGRIRGQELAKTLGQVIPFAAQLGISLDELNASVVAMTIGGLEARKTMTSLRAAMSGFLKPSEDMKRVLRELGFSSPEQLIAAKGFQGALEAVADASNNMASEIAKSFRNIRALTAELRLTQSGAEQVQEALEAMGKSTPESLNKIFEEFRSTDAERLTAEINRLKTTLTEDLGSAITQVLGSIIQFAGGADNISAAVQAIAAAAVPAGAALLGLAVAFATVNLAMGPVGLMFMVLVGAVSAFAGASAYATASAINDIRKLASEQRQATVEFIKNEEEKLRKVREAELEAIRQANKDWENRASVIRRDYFKALDDLKAKNEEIIESDRMVMQAMISSQQKVVNAYRSAARQNLRVMEQSRQREIQAEAQYSDAVFRYRTKRFSDYRKVEEYMQRSRQLARQAAEALMGAKTEDQVQAALAVQQRAESAAKEAESLAESTGSVIQQQDAHRNLLHIYRQKIDAERELQALQAEQAQENARRAAEEQARVNRMKVAMKGILESLEAFDKQGAKTPQELARQQATLQKNLEQLRKDWLGGKQVDIADLLAMDELQQRVETALEGGVSDVEVKRLFAGDETFEQFRQDIEAGIGPIRVLIEEATAHRPELRKAMAGMTAEESVAYLSKQLQDSLATIQRFREMGDALKVANQAFGRQQKQARTQLSQWMKEFGEEEARPLGDRLLQFNFPKKYQEMKDAILGFATLAEQFTRPGATISEEDFQTLNDAYKKYLDTINPGRVSRARLEEFIRDAAAAADQAENAIKLQGGLRALEQEALRAQQDIPAIQDALNAAERAARQTRSATDQAAISSGNAADSLARVASLNMGSLVSQINQAAMAMQSLAIASANVRPPSVPTEFAARGGPVRYLAGGGPAGTDVVPAMLTPGEFVMNAASTRKFAAQLVAMNAGVQPLFRSEGGHVTNVGDINVTVNGGGTSRQTARSIAAELRRELRRGTSTL